MTDRVGEGFGGVSRALVAIILLGLVSIVGVGVVFDRLATRFDRQMANERARIFIGEQIVSTVAGVESTMYQMSTAPGEPARRRLAGQIERAAEQLVHYLDVLQRGGVVRQELALNLYGQDEMVREEHYAPAMREGEAVIEVIEIAPFVDQIRTRSQELSRLLAERDACEPRDENCALVANDRLRAYYKVLPAFFYRLNENANRQFYESVGALRLLERNVAQERARLRYLQFGIVLLVIVSVMTAAVLYARRIGATQRQLEAAKEEAESASSAKTRFLATMSHEIRTPMNGILGTAQLLDSPGLDEAERRRYVRILLASGQTLLTLLNDILDLTKVEAGRLELQRVPASPAALAHETARLFEEAAQAKGLALRVDSSLPPGDRRLLDPVRVRQMISNLVGNAIRFTQKGSVCIEVREIAADGVLPMLEFAVVDTGIGIPRQKMDRLFQTFTQIHAEGSVHQGGTGLGLSIVRHLAQLMGGEVGATSEEGSGSRFWFRIRGEPATVTIATTSGARAGETRPVAPVRLAGRVLVADDNAVNRKIVEAALRRLGLQVGLANDGEQAVAAVRAEPFDLVLMDVKMPVLDGLQATGRIRAWEAEGSRRRLPIVALTANAYDEDRRQCSVAGMDDFVAKPVDFVALAEVLARWLPEGAAATSTAT